MNNASWNEAHATFHSLRDLIRWGASRFTEAKLAFGHGTDNALDEAAALAFHSVHLRHDLPAAYLDARLTGTEKEAIFALFQRRISERLPAAYLVGESWFAGHAFYVDPRVVIPRSSIAELIEQHFHPWLEFDRVLRILDLCTGSGCIAIACAHAFPEAEVDGVDISPDALAVAARNVAQHDLAARVKLHQSDLFAALDPGKRYDLIVSNPPYVSPAEMAHLPEEYRHEPSLGLDGGGGDGLALVMRILADAWQFLTRDGVLIVEVGASAPALIRRLPQVPFTWLEFERGGDGVLLLTGQQLHEFRPMLIAAQVAGAGGKHA